jgi:DNA (cytosine-5)-methyltransferase 1
MENVPDVLNHGGQNIAEEICEVLERKGYICGYTLLNASFHGVPQMRERMFLIGYRREVSESVTFPGPSHWMDLPSGYEGSRSVALKVLNGLFRIAHDYVDPPASHDGLPPAVTASDAIGDLPPIYALRLLKEGVLRRGARRFEVPRDYDLFARLNPGDQYPQAWQQATAMLAERLEKLSSKGQPLRMGSAAYEALRNSIVPPYDATKFPNKWRKMWRDQPARTLMAHLGKDGYSHIHYDSEQARTISVREAARLQSFPDGFTFSGTMNPAFRQIGNAVPPLLAQALGRQLLLALQGQVDERARQRTGT